MSGFRKRAGSVRCRAAQERDKTTAPPGTGAAGAIVVAVMVVFLVVVAVVVAIVPAAVIAQILDNALPALPRSGLPRP